MSKVVRIAVVDVDGCITPGEAGSWNWEALQTIRDLNLQARQDEALPAITLCTGRQEPYVEVLMQAIGGYLPCIYESGCGMYFPNEYRFLEHPAITNSAREMLTAAKANLLREVVSPSLGYFQPGKEASLTLYPFPGTSVSGLLRAVTDALSALNGTLTIQASVTCVDVTPTGIDKGRGVRWLAEQTGVPLTDMGGIGDSVTDLKFLTLVGQSAAPANAAAKVKAEVDYISPYENGNGVVDILHRWREGRSA